MKRKVMAMVAMGLLLSNALIATPLMYRDAAARYYNGEISQDEYVDQLIGPMNQQRTYRGEFNPNPRGFGGGYNYSDTDGTRAEIRPDGRGGWDVRGYGY